nr:WAT1-related protein At1g43650-like isoform X2 [Solanum lycopersicum]
MKHLVISCAMSMEKQKHYIAMLLTQAIFAGMALFSKAAISQGMNPYVFVTYRQAFAIIALAPLAAFFERKSDVPLSYNIMLKIFLMSLLSTLSLDLYYFSIHYTTATFAAASTNLIPAITFFMAVILRVEALAIKKSHGMAKLLGSSIGVTGALVFALVKGPQLNFMKGNTRGTHSSNLNYSLKEEWLKGSLVMVLANFTWSLWLILQGYIVTGLTYWIQLWTVEKKGPVFVSMFTPLSLIITAIVSAFLWKETLYVGSVCGGILLVGGLYLVLWGKNREAEREINQ